MIANDKVGLLRLVVGIAWAGVGTTVHQGAVAAPADEAARCAALAGIEVAGARIESAQFVAEATKLAPLNVPSPAQQK